MTIEEQLAAMQRQYVEQQRNLVESQQRLAALTATAVSPDHSLEITIGKGGDVTKVEVVGSRYRQMPPSELANLILETVRSAMSKYQQKVIDELPESPFDGVDIGDIVRGDIDWSNIAPADLAEPAFDFPVDLSTRGVDANARHRANRPVKSDGR